MAIFRSNISHSTKFVSAQASYLLLQGILQVPEERYQGCGPHALDQISETFHAKAFEFGK